MKIAFIMSLPKGRYSGGRNHALLLSAYLSDIGYEVDLFTNRWEKNGQYKNFVFNRINISFFRLWFTRRRYNFLIVVPEASSRRPITMLAQLFHLLSIRTLITAQERFFLDFESPLWKEMELNSKKPYWLHYNLVKVCDTVISSTHIGKDYAKKDYYKYGRSKRYCVLPPPQILEYSQIDAPRVFKQRSILLFFREKNLNKEDLDRLEVIVKYFRKDFRIHIVCDSHSFSNVIMYSDKNVNVYNGPDFQTLRQLYIQAFYFFNLSRFEGFGLTVCEASFYGCIVISTLYEVLSEVYPNCYISEFKSEEDCINILKIQSKNPYLLDLSKTDYVKMIENVFGKY